MLPHIKSIASCTSINVIFLVHLKIKVFQFLFFKGTATHLQGINLKYNICLLYSENAVFFFFFLV